MPVLAPAVVLEDGERDRGGRGVAVVGVDPQGDPVGGEDLEHGDARLVKVTAHRGGLAGSLERTGVIAMSFEAHLVSCVGVRDVDLPVGRMDDEVEEGGADSGVRGGLAAARARCRRAADGVRVRGAPS